MKVKTNKGITLIALIITIIVLLILAGVSIATLTGENGLLNKAETAKETTAQKTAEEQVKLAIMASYNASGEIDLGELQENLNNIEGVTEITEEITDASFPLSVIVDGQEVKLNKAGDTITAETKGETAAPTTSSKPGTYKVGDTFTVGGETFYVIEESDANTEIVKGLAAKNINITTMLQSDSAFSLVFSDTNYWSTISGITYPYDLNNTETSAFPHAITKAKAYGTSKGGIGRLMTVEEVIALGGDKDNYSSSACPSWINSSRYWLGSADGAYDVCIVNGINSFLGDDDYDDSYGVRPVLEISKSLVQ